MKHLGPKTSPTKSDYREWPLFKMFRTTEEFASTYQGIFGEPFGKVVTDEITSKEAAGLMLEPKPS